MQVHKRSSFNFKKGQKLRTSLGYFQGDGGFNEFWMGSGVGSIKSGCDWVLMAFLLNLIRSGLTELQRAYLASPIVIRRVLAS